MSWQSILKRDSIKKQLDEGKLRQLVSLSIIIRVLEKDGREVDQTIISSGIDQSLLEEAKSFLDDPSTIMDG
jgi:hypothetical protein